MKQYSMGKVSGTAATSVVHHTLPVSNVTACGTEVSAGVRGNGARSCRGGSWTDGKMSISYDLSAVTCAECRSALIDRVPDAEVQAQYVDAGWLRTQGEDFKSLRALVEAVDVSEKRLVGDDAPFKEPCSRGRFVRAIAEELSEIQGRRRGAPLPAPCETAPAGGLCHEDAATIVRHVRSAIKDLRGNLNAWPDDARVVAKNLERTLDGVLGVKQRAPEAPDAALCSSGCGAQLPAGVREGGLCARCMKGADVHRGR